MEILYNEPKRFVRIQIGEAETGFTGLRKPIKNINVEGTSVVEVYEMIYDLIKEEGRLKSGKRRR